MSALLRSVWLSGGLIALAASALDAAPLRLRAGEHEGFSRLVVEGAGPAGWSLRRVPQGYVFRHGGGTEGYDDSRVFGFIPRERIASLRSLPDGALEIRVDCDCHAKAFTTGNEAIVIDIADGAPDPDSPFERADAPPETDTADAPEPAARGGFRLAAPSDAPQAPISATDEYLEIYWPPPRDVPARDSGDSPAPTETMTDSPGASPDRAPAAAPLPAISPAEIQRSVLEQLGRAASQGLVDFAAPAETRSPSSANAAAPAEPAAPDPQTDDVAPAVPLRIETSIDRDAFPADPATALTAEGDICPPDALFDITAWGDERPPAIQIAAARSDLVGEFDRPDPVRIRTLARLYLYLGLGAEARMTLHAFDLRDDEAAWIVRLARIEDGEPPDAPDLADLAACDGSVAFWALLGSEAPLAERDLNAAAILAAFSALPHHLRLQLGARTIDRLVAIGAKDLAATLRSAITRAGPVERPDLGVAEAELALADGDEQAGLRHLDELAKGNGPAAVTALMRAIEFRLDRGVGVPPDLAESAGALGYELRHDAAGPKLSGLHLRALASTGDFDTAFAALSRLPDDFPAGERSAATRALFRGLAGNADDWTFLRHYFEGREPLLASRPDEALDLDLAERLTGAGFDTAAAEHLRGGAGSTVRGRRILATHAIRGGDPQRALDLLSGLQDRDAAAIRAEAFLLLDRAGEAQTQFGIADDSAGAGRAAWIGGDWRSAGDAPGVLASAAQALHLTQPGPAAPAGELAADRHLLENAARARDALRDLIAYGTAN